MIPVIKDEGNDTQNNERLGSMTLARMNLTDVYIILAWYEHAEPNLTRGGEQELARLLRWRVDAGRGAGEPEGAVGGGGWLARAVDVVLWVCCEAGTRPDFALENHFAFL